MTWTANSNDFPFTIQGYVVSTPGYASTNGLDIPFSVAAAAPSYKAEATNDTPFTVTATAATWTATSYDFPFTVTGSAGAFSFDAAKDFPFKIEGDLNAAAYKPQLTYDACFSISATAAYWEASLYDFPFTVTGSAGGFTVAATRDHPFKIEAVAPSWVTQTYDVLFSIEGVVPVWEPSAYDHPFTVNCVRMLDLLKHNLEDMENSDNATADLTKYALTLGIQDYVLGWYTPSYTESIIEGSIQPKDVTIGKLPIGGTAKYDLTLFTQDYIVVDDEVKDDGGDYYTVKAIESYWYLNKFSHYQCSLIKRTPHQLRPYISGTWSTASIPDIFDVEIFDGGEDPNFLFNTNNAPSGTDYTQLEIKDWLTANIDSAQLTLDNNTTAANYIITMGKSPYLIDHLFYDKGHDCIFCVGQPTLDTNGEYQEVPISINVVNKTGLTAIKLREKAEKELIRVVTDEPLGIYRGFQRKIPDAETDETVSTVTYILAYFTDTEVTKYALTIEEPFDEVTGWPARNYSRYKIDMLLRRKGSNVLLNNAFHSPKYTVTGYTPEAMNVGDRIVDGDDVTYTVVSAEKERFLNNTSYYTCELEQTDFSPSPSTSGVWHMDADGVVSDVRYRQKIWLTTFLSEADITLDDGVTLASTKTMFANTDLPLTQMFNVQALDGLFVVDQEPSEALYTNDHHPYGYIESLPITCYAINKAGATAANIVDKMVQAINKVATEYPQPYHNIRVTKSVKAAQPVNIGGALLWSTTVTVQYKRANDDYQPTLPSITNGSSLHFAETYIIPNVVNKVERYVNNDLYIDMPSRLGSFPMPNGSRSIEVELTMDLDVSPENLTWERPQNAENKTDMSPIQVFQDIWQGAEVSEVSQTLTLDWGSFPVRLVSMERGMGKDSNMLTVVFREYNASAANADYRHRLGITH